MEIICVEQPGKDVWCTLKQDLCLESFLDKFRPNAMVIVYTVAECLDLPRPAINSVSMQLYLKLDRQHPVVCNM